MEIHYCLVRFLQPKELWSPQAMRRGSRCSRRLRCRLDHHWQWQASCNHSRPAHTSVEHHDPKESCLPGLPRTLACVWTTVADWHPRCIFLEDLNAKQWCDGFSANSWSCSPRLDESESCSLKVELGGLWNSAVCYYLPIVGKYFQLKFNWRQNLMCSRARVHSLVLQYQPLLRLVGKLNHLAIFGSSSCWIHCPHRL